MAVALATKKMATSLPNSSFMSLLPTRPIKVHQNQQLFLLHNRTQSGRTHQKPTSFRVLAAKLPAGVELPKVEPRFEAPVFGFTRTAEIWNSRACMIGLIGTFILELILNKGILQLIGVDVGKGLDLPL